MRHLDGGITVKISRIELLNKLDENLIKHAKEYEAACINFKLAAAKILRKEMRKLKSGSLKGVNVSLAGPPDYRETYREAILMFSMSAEDLVELDSRQFRNLVLDQWDWKDLFNSSNAAYSGVIGSKR